MNPVGRAVLLATILGGFCCGCCTSKPTVTAHMANARQAIKEGRFDDASRQLRMAQALAMAEMRVSSPEFDKAVRDQERLMALTVYRSKAWDHLMNALGTSSRVEADRELRLAKQVARSDAQAAELRLNAATRGQGTD